jgi:nucleoside-diphosphate-sugar epimerase
MKIAVLGASGEIGARLTQHLFLAGCAPRALSRRPSPRLARWGDLDFRSVDLRGPGLAESLQDCNVVINCAIDKVRGADTGELVARNVAACRNLLAAARAAGVRRIVHLSSIVVLPPRISDDVLARADRYSLDKDWYARAKIETEKIMVRGARHVEVTVVRPGIVYGPYMMWSRLAFDRTAAGTVLLPAGVLGTCAAVHVDDLVGLTVHLTSLAGPVPTIVYGVNPEPVSWLEFYAAHAAEAGTSGDRVRLVPVESLTRALHPGSFTLRLARWLRDSPLLPDWLRGSRMLRAMARRVRSSLCSFNSPDRNAFLRQGSMGRPILPPSASDLEMYCSNATFSPDLVGNGIGFTYRISFAAGVATAGDWLNFREAKPAARGIDVRRSET